MRSKRRWRPEQGTRAEFALKMFITQRLDGCHGRRDAARGICVSTSCILRRFGALRTARRAPASRGRPAMNWSLPGAFPARGKPAPGPGRAGLGMGWMGARRCFFPHVGGWFGILVGSLGVRGAKAAGVIGADETPPGSGSFARERPPGWHLNSPMGHPMETEDGEKPGGEPCQADLKERSPDG